MSFLSRYIIFALSHFRGGLARDTITLVVHCTLGLEVPIRPQSTPAQFNLNQFSNVMHKIFNHLIPTLNHHRFVSNNNNNNNLVW